MFEWLTSKLRLRDDAEIEEQERQEEDKLRMMSEYDGLEMWTPNRYGMPIPMMTNLQEKDGRDYVNTYTNACQDEPMTPEYHEIMRKLVVSMTKGVKLGEGAYWNKYLMIFQDKPLTVEYHVAVTKACREMHMQLLLKEIA